MIPGSLWMCDSLDVLHTWSHSTNRPGSDSSTVLTLLRKSRALFSSPAPACTRNRLIAPPLPEPARIPAAVEPSEGDVEVDVAVAVPERRS